MRGDGVPAAAFANHWLAASGTIGTGAQPIVPRLFAVTPMLTDRTSRQLQKVHLPILGSGPSKNRCGNAHERLGDINPFWSVFLGCSRHRPFGSGGEAHVWVSFQYGKCG